MGVPELSLESVASLLASSRGSDEGTALVSAGLPSGSWKFTCERKKRLYMLSFQWLPSVLRVWLLADLDILVCSFISAFPHVVSFLEASANLSQLGLSLLRLILLLVLRHIS